MEVVQRLVRLDALFFLLISFPHDQLHESLMPSYGTH
jgi:hypothetical protein